MLFILAMEPLNRLLDLATSNGLLSPINSRAATLRASLYADDAAIFVNPTSSDLLAVDEILDIFGKVSGLITNRCKCPVYPIRCEGINLQEVLQGFDCPIMSFPCTYLGLPLHVRQLHRVDIQPLIDKMSNRLPTWKGKFLNKAGRLKLLNSSLSSIPTYFLTMFAPKKWTQTDQQNSSGFLMEGIRGCQRRSLSGELPAAKSTRRFGGFGLGTFQPGIATSLALVPVG
jgi:mannosylglycoprotein endo-beta-mannosidase